MAKTKTIFLMLALIFILILILVLKSAVSKKEESQQPQNAPAQLPSVQTNEIAPSTLPLPTINPNPSTSSFSVTHTSIKENRLGVVDSFQIFFSDQVAYQDLNYSISPEIKIELSLDRTGKVLTVKPEGIWSFDTEYKLTIIKKSKDIKGRQLDKDVVITFKTPPYSGI